MKRDWMPILRFTPVALLALAAAVGSQVPAAASRRKGSSRLRVQPTGRALAIS